MSLLHTLCLSQAYHLAKERYAKGMQLENFVITVFDSLDNHATLNHQN